MQEHRYVQGKHTQVCPINTACTLLYRWSFWEWLHSHNKLYKGNFHTRQGIHYPTPTLTEQHPQLVTAWPINLDGSQKGNSCFVFYTKKGHSPGRLMNTMNARYLLTQKASHKHSLHYLSDEMSREMCNGLIHWARTLSHTISSRSTVHVEITVPWHCKLSSMI